MEKTIDTESVYNAVRFCMNGCSSVNQLETAGNCVIEMLSAIGMDDEEIIDVLRYAQGMWIVTDDYIDEMIERIRG